MDLGPPSGFEHDLQTRGQVAVNFKQVQFGICFRQRPAERGPARPDFENNFTSHRVDGIDDPLNYVGIRQEVLSESLTCPMPHTNPLS